jgi:hypothetical protein
MVGQCAERAPQPVPALVEGDALLKALPNDVQAEHGGVERGRGRGGGGGGE